MNGHTQGSSIRSPAPGAVMLFPESTGNKWWTRAQGPKAPGWASNQCFSGCGPWAAIAMGPGKWVGNNQKLLWVQQDLLYCVSHAWPLKYSSCSTLKCWRICLHSLLWMALGCMRTQSITYSSNNQNKGWQDSSVDRRKALAAKP